MRNPPLRAAATLPGVGLALLLAASGAAASCIAIEGPFSSTSVLGPPCTSPILLCTDGRLEGSLEGTYYFTMRSMAPALAPQDPLLLVFTGESLITTSDGRMNAEDVGRMRYNPTGPTPFVTLVQVRTGTGAYAGVTGVIVAEGELDFSAGKAVGTYRGALCWP